jgi:hypothetical protein
MNETIIKSDGVSGIQAGGGGSGGGVSIDFSYLKGNANISAIGGNGKSSGGGGRIRFWNHRWKNQSVSVMNNTNINMVTLGGKGCEDILTCG